MQELERIPTKSAKDESELAQLQVKQQQILASGRPVNPPNVSEVRSVYSFSHCMMIFRKCT